MKFPPRMAHMSAAPESDELPQPESALSHEISDYEKMARDAVSSGQLLTAIEVARDGLARFRGDSRILKQMLALALAQTGALEAARAALDDVLRDSASDGETLCLIGRVYKELWRHAPTPAEGEAALRAASKFYGDAFARDNAYYPGINLAFTLAALGESAQAAECAAQVAKLCREIVGRAEGSAFSKALAALGHAKPKPDAENYGWALATLAEASLIQGRHEDAATHYRRAAGLFHGRWRDIASMRRQAHAILDLARQPADWLDGCFAFPAIVAFTGHMIDLPGRTHARFPPEREPAVREAIRAHLDRINAGFGYSSAASGGDIIFCECLLNREARVNLVLPCSVDRFKQQSVSPAGPEWERRFHHVLANANNVMFANPPEFTLTQNDPAAASGFIFTNRIVTGMAALQARALDLELETLAVWDGLPGDGIGGTATVVEEWRRAGRRPHLIPVHDAARDATITAAPANAAPPAPAAPPPPATDEPATTPRHEIKALVFLEVFNYARIAENQIPHFVRAFKQPIARIIAALPAPPIAAEGAGASMSFTFDELGSAARLALEVRDRVRELTAADQGLPRGLGVRIFLHAAPVYAFTDPVLGRTACMGAHVTRAARITQIVPSGQIYVSQEFAALCGAAGIDDLSFEYLGPLPTSQLFYNTPLHRLDRATLRS